MACDQNPNLNEAEVKASSVFRSTVPTMMHAPTLRDFAFCPVMLMILLVKVLPCVFRKHAASSQLKWTEMETRLSSYFIAHNLFPAGRTFLKAITISNQFRRIHTHFSKFNWHINEVMTVLRTNSLWFAVQCALLHFNSIS